MARLADDWEPQRGMCIDVLCAYLRMPCDPQRAAEGKREVRRTVIRLIRDHLRPLTGVTWGGLRIDLTGATFDGGDFAGAAFSGGKVTFRGATFSGAVSLRGATFSSGRVSFRTATFGTGGRVDFRGAAFGTGGTVDFRGAAFSGGTVNFRGATFSGGTVNFDATTFSGGTVDFSAVRSWDYPPRGLPAAAPGLLLPAAGA